MTSRSSEPTLFFVGRNQLNVAGKRFAPLPRYGNLLIPHFLTQLLPMDEAALSHRCPVDAATHMKRRPRVFKNRTA